jgi:eukaryotic-like serine/threonine-protein kinase
MNKNPPGIETILAHAVEIAEPAGRQAFVEHACGGDRALQHQVERLIANHFQAGSFLERPAVARDPNGTAGCEAAESASGVGTVIGPYKLLEQIGEGGMGLVFVAEQHEPIKRRVALKIIKPGMDSRQVIARFEAERQALALMDHPHIAKVHDGGTTPEGRPYFVMELVKGTPITDYCDTHRLTTRQRLELFLDVCSAVQHAHQKGIIHRDLKPSNVLVSHHDVTPVVKVIDFGIAKATSGRLTDKTVYTAFAQMVGTPPYMSPEQAGLSDLDVDTRSDGYSLGVLLYELLTGTTPFDSETWKKAGYDEMRRIIREDEPPRPSTRLSTMEQAALSTIAEKRGLEPRRLSQQLRGELDWIVMKALDKDRNRRYESASAFAADVQRYLEDEPVQACPPSAGYRFRKFVRRNKVALVTAGLVTAALVIGTAVSVWQAVEANAAYKLAGERLESEKQARLQADYHSKQAETNAGEARKQTAEAVRAREDAERHRSATYQNLYHADMRLGLVDWNAGNLARLTQKLLSHVPKTGGNDLRAWEWYYLLSLCHQEERTLSDHHGLVHAIAWSPDGRYLASTGYDGTTKVWDAKSWRLLRSIDLNFAFHKGIAWSSDSQRLAWGDCADSSSTVYVWHMRTDKIQTLPGHTSSVWTVAWSPDGKQLASAGMDGTIRIWEPATGSCRHVMKVSAYITAVAWSPDGKRLASAGWLQVQIWDAVSGQALLHDGLPSAGRYLAWSPDGKQLAVATQAGQCLLYNAADCSATSKWDAHKGEVNWVAWNPEGSLLASAGGDSLIKLWDPGSRTCVGILRGHVNPAMCVAWEPNGHRLASGGMDGKVKVWSVPPAPQPRRLDGHPGGIETIAWSKDAATLQSLGVADYSIALWDVVSGKRVAQVPLGGRKAGQFSPTGECVAVASRSAGHLPLLICDARSGKHIQIVKTITPNEIPDYSSFSPDGSRLALIREGPVDVNGLEVVDLQRNETCFRWQHHNFNAVSWSPNGRFLACTGAGDASDGGNLQFAGWMHVFDLEKCQRIWKLRHGTHRVGTTAVTWSPNGQLLVSGDGNGLAEIWAATTGKKVASLQLHAAAIKALAWSPDGRRIASGGEDQVVLIWDPFSGEELLRFDVPSLVAPAPDGGVTPTIKLQWSADGRRLAAACTDGTIQIWDASIGYQFVGSESYYADEILAQNREATELQKAGRNDDAIALLEQTLKDSKARLGSDHRATLISMNNLAVAYQVAGRHQEAIALLEATLEKGRATLGPDDMDTLQCMFNLAWSYQHLDRFREAISLFEQRLEKLKAKFGSDYVLFPGIPELVDAYQDAGKLDQAERLLRDLLQRQRKEYGPKSDKIAGTLARLGVNLLMRQQYVAAEPILRECLAIREQQMPDYWLRYNTLSMLGGALLGQKKYAEAEPLLLGGYEGMKQREVNVPAPGKVRLVQAAERLSLLYEATNQPEKVKMWREKLSSGKRPGRW